MAKVGRPLKFETVEILEKKINEYFNSTDIKMWTITGLALALDTDRITLINYEEKPEFINTIRKAKLMVEHSYELDLKKDGKTGTIFALKNFDWSDKTETDLTTNGKDITALPQPIFNIKIVGNKKEEEITE